MNFGIVLTVASLSLTLAKDDLDLDPDSGPFDLSKVPVSTKFVYDCCNANPQISVIVPARARPWSPEMPSFRRVRPALRQILRIVLQEVAGLVHRRHRSEAEVSDLWSLTFEPLTKHNLFSRLDDAQNSDDSG